MSEPGLRVVAVMAKPELEDGHESPAARLDAVPRSFKTETQPRHDRFRCREVTARTARRVRGRAHHKRIALRSELQPTVRTRANQYAPKPRAPPHGELRLPYPGFPRWLLPIADNGNTMGIRPRNRP